MVQTQLQRYLATKDAARFLGISPNTLRKLVATGKLRALRPSDRKLTFDADTLVRYMASRSA